MSLLPYLAACAAVGMVVGRAFGEFARAGFHYPPRIDAASPWHQAILSALDVLEWPSLFALTLASALALWVWLRPRRSPPARASHPAMLIGLLAAIAAAIVVPFTNRPGQPLAAVLAALMGALLGALLLAYWREAATGTRSVRARWLSQLPLATGHLLATTAAALSLGYRGENALAHGIALLIGFGLFGVEVVIAIPIAALAWRLGAHRR